MIIAQFEYYMTADTYTLSFIDISEMERYLI